MAPDQIDVREFELRPHFIHCCVTQCETTRVAYGTCTEINVYGDYPIHLLPHYEITLSTNLIAAHLEFNGIDESQHSLLTAL